MSENCEKLIEKEREREERERADTVPRIPVGLEQMLRSIYEMCLDHKPTNIFRFISRKLESKLNQRTLSDDVDLDYYYMDDDDDEFFKEFRGDSSHEAGNVKQSGSSFDGITNELLMQAYHNREPKYYEVIEDLIQFNLFDSLYDACRQGGDFCRKTKPKCLIKPFSYEGTKAKRQTTSELAWSVNGDRSIYNPKDTPLAHFLRAHPEYISKFSNENEIQEEPKPCDKVVPVPYWYKKKPKKKTLQAMDLQVKESTFTAGNVTADRSEIDLDRAEELKYLAILILCYAAINDKPAEFEPYSLAETVDDQAMDKDEKVVQTDYCISCPSHSLIDGVEFFSPTCLYMINKGVGLNSPCWSCMSYRAFVKLDWKEFLRKFIVSPSPSGKRNWLECDDFLENVKFEECKEPEVVGVFEISEEEAFDEAFEPSEPDPIPKEVFWSEEDQQMAISLKSKLTKFKWEAQTKLGVPDQPDVLPVLTRLNIYLPPRDDPSIENEPDQPGEFPKDMIVTLHPLETVALKDYPDTPNKLRLTGKSHDKN